MEDLISIYNYSEEKQRSNCISFHNKILKNISDIRKKTRKAALYQVNNTFEFNSNQSNIGGALQYRFMTEQNPENNEHEFLIRIPINSNQDTMSIYNSTRSVDELSSHDRQTVKRKDPLYNDNRFKFTQDEDYILQLKVLEEIQYNEQLLKTINWRYVEIEGRHQIELVRRCIELIRKQNNEKTQDKWSQEQDQRLLNAVKIHGINNWREVINNVEGKSSVECRLRYYQINPQIKRDKWNEEEDIQLTIAAEFYRKKNQDSQESLPWAQICEIFNGTRTDMQCRERYRNILDPNLVSEKWSPQEDTLLLQLAEEFNHQWSQIAKELGNKRTDNQCKRRWIKLQNQQQKRKNSVQSDNKFNNKRRQVFNIEYIKHENQKGRYNVSTQ